MFVKANAIPPLKCFTRFLKLAFNLAIIPLMVRCDPAGVLKRVMSHITFQNDLSSRDCIKVLLKGDRDYITP